MSEPIATLMLVEEGLIELHYQPNAKIDPVGLHQLLSDRLKLCGNLPHKVLSFVPEGIDFDRTVMDQNLYGDPESVALTRALAIVITDPVNTQMLELFFAYHPAKFPLKLFTVEAEARAWLRTH